MPQLCVNADPPEVCAAKKVADSTLPRIVFRMNWTKTLRQC